MLDLAPNRPRVGAPTTSAEHAAEDPNIILGDVLPSEQTDQSGPSHASWRNQSTEIQNHALTTVTRLNGLALV